MEAAALAENVGAIIGIGGALWLMAHQCGQAFATLLIGWVTMICGHFAIWVMS